MDDNISLKKKLSFFPMEIQTIAQIPNRATFLRILTPVLTSLNSNMVAVSESLKLIHNVNKHDGNEAESASKSLHRSPESGVSTEVNDQLTEGQTAQDKSLNTTESRDDVLDGIAQSLDEAERTAEPISEKLANVANKSWLHKFREDQLKAIR